MASPVNAVPMGFQPVADLTESAGMFWEDGALCGRAEIKQVIATHTCRPDQIINQALGGFVVVIIEVNPPIIIDGHTDFDGHVIYFGGIEPGSIISR